LKEVQVLVSLVYLFTIFIYLYLQTYTMCIYLDQYCD